MVKIEPTAATSTSSVHLGFVLRDAEPMPWRDRVLFQPEFLEVRYFNHHTGEGWSWSADIRGRRINGNGRLGAPDASLWFTDSERWAVPPTWVRETAEANMPGEDITGFMGSWTNTAVTLGDQEGSKGMAGMWRGRYPVRLMWVRGVTDEVRLEAVDPGDARLVGSRSYSVVEFVPDEA